MGTEITVDSDDVKKLMDIYISSGRSVDAVRDGCDEAWERLRDALPIPSTFTCYFDENSVYWNRNKEMNIIFLKAQQNYFNHVLQARGHVFLNEVLDALGLNRTSRGQLVGWVAEKGVIDFGMPGADSFVFNKLELNVQGEIYKELDD